MKNDDVSFIKEYYSKIKWMKLKNKNKHKNNSNPFIKPNESTQLCIHKIVSPKTHQSVQKIKANTHKNHKSEQIFNFLGIAKVKMNQMYSIHNKSNPEEILKIEPVKRYQIPMLLNRVDNLKFTRKKHCKTCHTVTKFNNIESGCKLTARSHFITTKSDMYTPRNNKPKQKESINTQQEQYSRWKVDEDFAYADYAQLDFYKN